MIGFVVPQSGTKKHKVTQRVYLLFFYFVSLCGNSAQLCGITFFSYGFVVPPSGTKKRKVRKRVYLLFFTLCSFAETLRNFAV